MKFAKAAMGLALMIMLGGMALPAPAQFNNGRPARPNVTPPMGPARAVILRSCTSCHGINDLGYHAMDRAGWDAMIEKMKVTKSGLVEGAVISDEDKEILLDWLVERFGPDSTAFPREYVPRELTEADYFSDEQAEALLATTCESCHAVNERVDGVTGNDARWRAILLDMIGRGAQLALNDVEPMVEWLVRTKGMQAN